MEESEESRNDLMQRLKSAGTATSSSIPKQPNRLDLSNFSSNSQSRAAYRHFSPNFSPDSNKRPGIPPAHPHFPPTSPYSQIPPSAAAAASSRSPSASASAAHNFIPVPSHSRSLSQPAFFSLDSLPPFSTPSPPFADPASTATSLSDPSSPDVPLPPTNFPSGSARGATFDGLPPRKAHRRSQSDIPFGFLPMPSLPPLPHQSSGFPTHLVSPRDPFGSAKLPAQLVKKESEWDRDAAADSSADRKSEGDAAAADDYFSAFMNLDSLDTLNSSGTEEKREDLDSRASGTKTNNGGADSSDNEAESSVNESGSSGLLRSTNPSSSGEKREGMKRSAVGDPGPVALTSRHCRSVSMDSFMGKLHYGEESPKLPPSPGPRSGQHSHSGSMDGTTNTFSLEFGNGEFSGAELKKIMANEKLAEIALSDPKRAKRILANRQSAARSKERKMRYISELEHKVQTLQTEATTLSAQLTLLQRDSAGLTSQNNELKFRLQAMEQQAHLRDALNDALNAEVQRLKIATGEAQLANSLNQQMQLNPQMFQMQQLQKQQTQQQQSSQIPHYQLQPQQQQQVQQHHQQQQNNDASKNESNK